MSTKCAQPHNVHKHAHHPVVFVQYLHQLACCCDWHQSCPEFIRGGRKSDNKRPVPGAERIKLGSGYGGVKVIEGILPRGHLARPPPSGGFKPKQLRPNLKYVDFGHCCGLGGLECFGRRGSEEPNIPPEIHAQIGWGPERVT